MGIKWSFCISQSEHGYSYSKMPKAAATNKPKEAPSVPACKSELHQMIQTEETGSRATAHEVLTQSPSKPSPRLAAGRRSYIWCQKVPSWGAAPATPEDQEPWQPLGRSLDSPSQLGPEEP